MFFISDIMSFGKFWIKDHSAPPAPPPSFCKNYYSGPIGNRFVDLPETGLWTNPKLVCGPIGNQFMEGTRMLHAKFQVSTPIP